MTEQIYCSHTCKNCEIAFMSIDSLNAYLYPPDYKYCPDCVRKGFKNTPELKEEYRIFVRFQEYIYKWQETCDMDKKDIDFIFDKCLESANLCIKYNKPIRTKNILNEAIEVLGYYKEELKEKENDSLS